MYVNGLGRNVDGRTHLMVATDGPEAVSDGRDALELDPKIRELDPSKICNPSSNKLLNA